MIAPTMQNNFLSARGLGGAHALAIARANLVFASTVCPFLTNYFIYPFASKFLRGRGGTSRKKFPHKHVPHKHVPPQTRSPTYRAPLTIAPFFDMIMVEKFFGKILEKSVTFGTKGRVI